MKDLSQLPDEEFQLPTPSGAETVKGKLIGFATSHRERHTKHTDAFALPHTPCRACRWHEVRIILKPNGEYAVSTVGMSIVPGEVVKCRVVTAMSGYEIVELLTVRPIGKPPFLPPSSARALAQAATRVKDIEQAYVNRAVV